MTQFHVWLNNVQLNFIIYQEVLINVYRVQLNVVYVQTLQDIVLLVIQDTSLLQQYLKPVQFVFLSVQVVKIIQVVLHVKMDFTFSKLLTLALPV